MLHDQLQYHAIYIYHIASGFLSREKTFANFAFRWRFAKVFSAKIYFQAIRYRASGRGALGSSKFAKVFSAKIYFQAIRESFIPPLYGIHFVLLLRIIIVIIIIIL